VQKRGLWSFEILLPVVFFGRVGDQSLHVTKGTEILMGEWGKKDK
jgi:hypothetical protein